MRFNPPPGWPTPPPGWTPPAGWTPNPEWPAAPAGWQFYVDDQMPFAGQHGGSPGGPVPLMTTARPNRPWYQKKRFLIPIGGVVALTLVGIFAPDPAPTVKVADAPASTAASLDASPEASAAATEAARPTATAVVKPPAPSPTPKPRPKKTVTLTSGQRNALDKAADYLDFQAFSRKGLIGQLKYEGYTTSEATYGVDHVKANWNDQAVKKAKEYLSQQSFSRSGLIGQLEYEGFTPSQAKHGVKAAY